MKEITKCLILLLLCLLYDHFYKDLKLLIYMRRSKKSTKKGRSEQPEEAEVSTKYSFHCVILFLDLLLALLF